ncbi:hypothetical protein E2C01_076902 [Portunus trituberculatus]|uniref:Uncharacterized protein n=1 Tax=Portunus trituberculatus TaxID=210409 RepID=A0A5B7IJS5_PORTR|nr:hypothetical protein [Portunus trituberculatus]
MHPALEVPPRLQCQVPRPSPSSFIRPRHQALSEAASLIPMCRTHSLAPCHGQPSGTPASQVSHCSGVGGLPAQRNIPLREVREAVGRGNARRQEAAPPALANETACRLREAGPVQAASQWRWLQLPEGGATGRRAQCLPCPLYIHYTVNSPLPRTCPASVAPPPRRATAAAGPTNTQVSAAQQVRYCRTEAPCLRSP